MVILDTVVPVMYSIFVSIVSRNAVPVAGSVKTIRVAILPVLLTTLYPGFINEA